ncbi:CDGSH iron-sulfur domain-containing protein [Knoellia sp. CPCC 206450]|uniref:CDGSH iron-sulfur domain-containing protein n=1 Tax=Knoellia tibetensis TaxID=3404798 RepID=UPI003B42A83B
MTTTTDDQRRELPPNRVGRVVVTGEGPILVEGPVDVVTADGTTVRSERGLVALCTCRRSRISPFCDTSHRDKVRAERQAPAEGGTSS